MMVYERLKEFEEVDIAVEGGKVFYNSRIGKTYKDESGMWLEIFYSGNDRLKLPRPVLINLCHVIYIVPAG